jgi:hypothetical protein
MGIRIHKAIGYGLNDLENGLEDTRLTSDWIEAVYESDFDDFKKFLEDKDKCIQVLADSFADDESRWDYGDIELFLNSMDRLSRTPFPSDFLDFDGEINNNWILFYPAENIKGGLYSDWKRFDDTIDYYENRVYKKELESIIIDLSKYGTLGIFPYNHGMHLKPGRENKLDKYKSLLSKHTKNYIEGRWYNMLVGDWCSKQKPWADEETIKHLKEDWHPIIPTSIKLFVYYFGIFANPYTVFDLRPLLCQWWA